MRKAVFLDRDGTLIRNHHYGCDPNSIQLMDGVVEAEGAQGTKLSPGCGNNQPA